MNEPARRTFLPRRWPMTPDAWRSLVDELERLRRAAAVPGAPADGVVDLDVLRAGRRLGALTAVLEAAEQTREPEAAVIGRRVTVLEADGESATYLLVCPGDGDPARGWISADSPLGAAVLARVPGDRVEVAAPAGSRVVTVVSVG